LDNELTGIPSYDNLQFATQAMEWLASGRDPEDVIIVFDEAHLLPTSGRASINSAASFGTTQGYVNWLSTNPIFGLYYPLFAVLSLRRWIPKEGSKKKLQLKDLEEDERKRAILKFRTSSFFAQKINWYRTHHKYRQALLQLFRRLQRKINRLLGDSGNRSVEAIMLAIRRERGRFISKNDYIRIQKFFEFMRDLKLNKANIKDEREFEDHFLEMGWINDKI
jgi:Rad3-related DNA helicase